MSATILMTQFASLDGIMEAPGGEDFKHEGWSFKFNRGDDGDQFKLDETIESDALLVGKKTYESFAGAWPEREGPFADKFNEMPKYVVSTTLGEPGWNNVTVLDSGDATAQVTKLKEEFDGVIQIPGSNRLVHELMEAGLIDRVNLMIFPVVLGVEGAKTVFGPTSDKSEWSLTEFKTVGDEGVVVMSYERR
jgi:dihydrofolate reductase